MFVSDTLAPATVGLINDAIITAAATGSRSGGARRDERFLNGGGIETFVKVDRVVARNSNAWRVTDASDESVVGLVVPWASSLPGRHTSHAIDNDFADLAV